jgi:hypothetical protein
MNDEARDPLLARLAQLPLAEPRAAASERVRARCHARLARRQTRRARSSRTAAARLIDATLALAAGSFLVVTAGAALALIR